MDLRAMVEGRKEVGRSACHCASLLMVQSASEMTTRGLMVECGEAIEARRSQSSALMVARLVLMESSSRTV